MVAIRRLAPLCMVLCAVFSLTSASRGWSAIHHCIHADGSILFTQFDCPLHSVPEDPEPGGGGGLSIVTGPRLTGDEQRLLATIEQSLAANRQARKQDRRRRATERRSRQAQAMKLCTEAVRSLKGIYDSRRKGYTTAEERHFDTEEARWQEIRRANC